VTGLLPFGNLKPSETFVDHEFECGSSGSSTCRQCRQQGIKSDVITASAAISAAAWESGVHLLEGLRQGRGSKILEKWAVFFTNPCWLMMGMIYDHI
jgi:hypothetical protein